MTESSSFEAIKSLLDRKVAEYNQPGFIVRDPISVPHRFSKKQDIEIAGFLTALISWGNRTTILRNANDLMDQMDASPHQFILQHVPGDLKRLLHFKHRTFNATDLLYLIHFLQQHYNVSDSLETAFMPKNATAMKGRLIYFNQQVFAFDPPQRTRKHVATPERNSACKRINMFLRWMVRQDKTGVDVGIWQHIAMHELICPMDIHVSRVASRLGLIQTDKANWNTAIALTEKLRLFDAKDPCKYDFALFGLGAEERVR